MKHYNGIGKCHEQAKFFFSCVCAGGTGDGIQGPSTLGCTHSRILFFIRKQDITKLLRASLSC